MVVLDMLAMPLVLKVLEHPIASISVPSVDFIGWVRDVVDSVGFVVLTVKISVLPVLLQTKPDPEVLKEDVPSVPKSLVLS